MFFFHNSVSLTFFPEVFLQFSVKFVIIVFYVHIKHIGLS